MLLDLLGRGDFDVALNGIEVADEKQRVALLTRAYYVARAPDGPPERRDRAAHAGGAPWAARRYPARLARRAHSAGAGAEVRTYDGGQNEIMPTWFSAAPTPCCSTPRSASTTARSSPLSSRFPATSARSATRSPFRSAPTSSDGARRCARPLAADGRLRALRAVGIAGRATAALLGDPQAESRGVAEALEAAHRGRKPLPFLERLRSAIRTPFDSSPAARSSPSHCRSSPWRSPSRSA